MYVVVRAETPTALAAGLRVAVRETDPDLPVFRLRTVLEGFADENSSNRLLSAMFAAFAGIAVLLATAGLYGVMSHAVSQRTAEIAVRMALGASAREVARNVVGGSVKLAVLGTLIGLAGAFGLAQTMTSILFGVTASDAATYIASAGLVLAAAVIAAWVPMRRAALIDPIQSLRRA
jgi:ABC-type antimicrobial peptide transport system permease subunit